jgi:hypothetical protein
MERREGILPHQHLPAGVIAERDNLPINGDDE